MTDAVPAPARRVAKVGMVATWNTLWVRYVFHFGDIIRLDARSFWRVGPKVVAASPDRRPGSFGWNNIWRFWEVRSKADQRLSKFQRLFLVGDGRRCE